MSMMESDLEAFGGEEATEAGDLGDRAGGEDGAELVGHRGLGVEAQPVRPGATALELLGQAVVGAGGDDQPVRGGGGGFGARDRVPGRAVREAVGDGAGLLAAARLHLLDRGSPPEHDPRLR